MPPEGLKVKSGGELCLPIAARRWTWRSFEALARKTRGSIIAADAVLFDLDGVLVDTAEMHYQSWKQLADELGLRFSREINEGFRGVGRMECLEKLLGPHRLDIALAEKQVIAERKNAHYGALIARLKPADLAPGATLLLQQLRQAGVALAVVSASKNARRVLDLLEITSWFDTVVDGHAVTRSKPDPQAFAMAADRLGASPARCVVIEDADAGLRGAHAAGMKAIGIGPVVGPLAYVADAVVPAVGDISLELLARVMAPAPRQMLAFETTPMRLSA